MARPVLHVTLARQRGFCAGVERAIALLDTVVQRSTAPVFVLHEIVHNPHVLDRFRRKGVHFVDSLDTIPRHATVVFSAHGVAPEVFAAARHRHLHCIDATCPLVNKVQNEVKRYVRQGRQVILIGHAGHPEVIGIQGQVPDHLIHLVESVHDVTHLVFSPDTLLGLVTQTTLSCQETAEIVQALRQRFPNIRQPAAADICYATTNRQCAAMELAASCDAAIVMGGYNSSNSASLRDTLRQHDCQRTLLIESTDQLNLSFLTGIRSLGITSGASTPEVLIKDLLAHLAKHFEIEIVDLRTEREQVHFKLEVALPACLQSSHPYRPSITSPIIP